MARSRFNHPIEGMTLQNMPDNGVWSLPVQYQSVPARRPSDR
jgi:hypothetical protein